MPRTKQTVVRLTHPNDPTEWYDCLLPITEGDIEDGKFASDETSPIKVKRNLLLGVLQAWSFDDKPSLEGIREMDLDTFNWLSEKLAYESGFRSTAEKKGSSPLSAPTTAPAAGASRKNSTS